MNIPDIRRYHQELSAVLEQVDNGRKALNQITALLRAAKTANVYEQQMQLQQQKERTEQQVKMLETALEEITQRDDVEASRTLHIDLAIRIDASLEEFARWRRLIAEFEFSVAEGSFAPEPEAGEMPAGYTRAMAEAELTAAKKRVQLRVAQAENLVPNRPVLLV